MAGGRSRRQRAGTACARAASGSFLIRCNITFRRFRASLSPAVRSTSSPRANRVAQSRNSASAGKRFSVGGSARATPAFAAVGRVFFWELLGAGGTPVGFPVALCDRLGGAIAVGGV